ncbi:hypothetical protein CC80DRAFT_7846 [Byssothecium circinans]|uniref:MARVEL domain-containing protein n=1 Tax=Byssothecium circinans TaxID=147558 RepID=A0A6A5UHR7_9PLEO|nr:hypothetical protein CC80DRAFT_7846 [Byssothecium circinans]
MGIFTILEKPFFHPRHKLPVHVAQIFLVAVAMGCSVPRLFMKNQPRTRANTVALGMGAKSLIIIIYMIVTEHNPRFKKWKSYKANVILSCLEVVFWGTVAFLAMRANLRICTGALCVLSWVVVVVAVVIVLTELYTAAVCIREFREYRRTKNAVQIESPRGSWKQSDIEVSQLSYPTTPRPVRV